MAKLVFDLKTGLQTMLSISVNFVFLYSEKKLPKYLPLDSVL